MRMHSIHATMFFATLFLATLGWAGEDDVAVITRQSREFSDASATSDAKVLDKYLDENVVFMTEGGEISSKHDILASLTPPRDGISNKLVQSDLKVSMHGNVAVTSFTDISTMSVYG